jgi:hypothetical protein
MVNRMLLIWICAVRRSWVLAPIAVFAFHDLRAQDQPLTEVLLRSAVLVQYDFGNQTSSGTGFFVYRPLQGDKGHVFLITNKHVLPKKGIARSILIRVATGPTDQATVTGVPVLVEDKNGEYLPKVRLNHDEADIAAVNVTDEINANGIQATWIPLSLLVTPEQLKSEGITVGDEIFVLGFPATIYDQRNTFPILKTGVIASVPLQGYAFNQETLLQHPDLPSKLDGFLIDASVFPGSSGSIVVLKPIAVQIGKNGTAVITLAKRTPYVLGILAGSIPMKDNDLNTNERIGLGVVYSASAIRKVIESFYQ